MQNGFIYIMALLFTVALTSFVTYDSERARSSRSALGVVLLTALVSLFVGTVTEVKNIRFEDLVEYNTESEESFRDKSLAEAFAKGVKKALMNEFSFEESDVEVACLDFDIETARARKISVRMSGSAAFSDIRAVREYVESAGLGECEVTVLFE